MGKNIKPGFFSIEDTHAVLAAPTIFEAKRHAHKRVIAYKKEHPLTELKNLADAERMINGCATKAALAMAIANWVMAHPSEGLGVLK